MTRKSIFELVEENYNIQEEIRKINRLLFEEKYFVQELYDQFTLEELIEDFLFIDWKYRGTCLSIKDFMKRTNALINYKDIKTEILEDVIVNNLECIENFINYMLIIQMTYTIGKLLNIMMDLTRYFIHLYVR